MCCSHWIGPLTILVLALTVAGLVLRPRGINEGIAATLGALAVLALGTATPADVWRGAVDTAGVLVFLVAMMIVAVVAEEAGCFDWAAGRAVALSRGRGRLLFLNLYLLGAVVTVFLSLDVTAIMIAPIVCALVRRARLSAVPFVMGCAYVANTASLFLPVSNLTNMLVYSLLHVPFWAFIRLLTLPNLAAMAINLVVFLVVFRRDIPRRFELVEARGPSEPDPVRLAVAGVGLVAVVAGLLSCGALGLPLYLPAVVGASVLAVVALARQYVRPEQLADGVAWSLPFFVVGMDTVVTAADRVGLGAVWSTVMPSQHGAPGLLNLLVVAYAAAVGSNLVNNLPMSLVVISGVGAGPRAAVLGPAFAGLIGTNVGSNVTMFGSLATMLVLHAARRYGYRIKPTRYLVVGLITTPLMVAAATVVLWLVVRG